MIAERNRIFGDFDTCVSVIQSIDNDKLDWLKEKFLNEYKQKNRWVIQLN